MTSPLFKNENKFIIPIWSFIFFGALGVVIASFFGFNFYPLTEFSWVAVTVCLFGLIIYSAKHSVK